MLARTGPNRFRVECRPRRRDKAQGPKGEKERLSAFTLQPTAPDAHLQDHKFRTSPLHPHDEADILAPMIPARIRFSLVASSMSIALSCTPSSQGRPEAVAATPDQCPLFERDPLKEPDLMAWDPTQRQKLNEKRDDGVVTVRMQKIGCDVTAHVVDCIGKVGTTGARPYAFKWYYTSDTVMADSQREAYAKLPLGAASLGADLGEGRSLRVDFVMAGSYVLPDGVEVKNWVGRDCAEATHYVKRMVVGGFARASGEREAVHADVGLFGVGAGAGQQTSRLSWRKEGSPEACREAEKNKGEIEGCNMPLRLELEPIPGREEAEQPVPTRERPPVATPEPTPQPVQPPRPVAGSSCPAGMASIPGGAFMMGSDSGESDEKPTHRVELDGFCMDVTEVTVDAFAQCVSAGRCSTPGTSQYCNWGVSGRGSHPINCVDWNQATAYCQSAGKSLPTESQWEYAARGGSQGRLYSWGSEAPGSQACWNRSDSTCVVGSYAAGAFGLRDMTGNVWEWVQDWYGPYPQSASKNHAGPSSGTYRVLRGGSWGDNGPSYLRAADRSYNAPGYRDSPLGFRCVRNR